VQGTSFNGTVTIDAHLAENWSSENGKSVHSSECVRVEKRDPFSRVATQRLTNMQEVLIHPQAGYVGLRIREQQ